MLATLSDDRDFPEYNEHPRTTVVRKLALQCPFVCNMLVGNSVPNTRCALSSAIVYRGSKNANYIVFKDQNRL